MNISITKIDFCFYILFQINYSKCSWRSITKEICSRNHLANNLRECGFIIYSFVYIVFRKFSSYRIGSCCNNKMASAQSDGALYYESDSNSLSPIGTWNCNSRFKEFYPWFFCIFDINAIILKVHDLLKMFVIRLEKYLKI